MDTIADIAKKFGVSHTAVSGWIKKGCPHTMIQKYQLRNPVAHMNAAEVEAWLAERRKQKGITTAAQKGGEA